MAQAQCTPQIFLMAAAQQHIWLNSIVSLSDHSQKQPKRPKNK